MAGVKVRVLKMSARHYELDAHEGTKRMCGETVDT